MAAYVSVGKVGEFPPNYVRGFKIEGVEIAVVNREGKVYAFNNTCTHMDVDIAEAETDGDQLTCWFHGSVFDVTNGKALVGPAYKPLKMYSVRIEGDDVQVSQD